MSKVLRQSFQLSDLDVIRIWKTVVKILFLQRDTVGTQKVVQSKQVGTRESASLPESIVKCIDLPLACYHFQMLVQNIHWHILRKHHAKPPVITPGNFRATVQRRWDRITSHCHGAKHLFPMITFLYLLAKEDQSPQSMAPSIPISAKWIDRKTQMI